MGHLTSVLTCTSYVMKFYAVRLTNGEVCSKPKNGFKYCNKHFIEYKKECREYHIFHSNTFYEECAIVAAEEELVLRKRFAYKFDIRTDERHSVWETFLKTFIEKISVYHRVAGMYVRTGVFRNCSDNYVGTRDFEPRIFREIIREIPGERGLKRTETSILPGQRRVCSSCGVGHFAMMDPLLL